MTAPCNNQPAFFPEDAVKVAATSEECCGDIPADALVYYNALYCHVDSANFSAHPTYLDPPCLTQDIVLLGNLIGDTPTDAAPEPEGTGDSQAPATEDDPPVSETPPDTEPPVDEPDPTTDPDVPDEDPNVDPSPEDDPPPDPDPEPEPPVEQPSTLRYATGMWYSTGGSMSYGKEPMRDAVLSTGFDLLTKLFAARAGKYCIQTTPGGKTGLVTLSGDPELNPSSPLYDPTAVIGGFSLRNAKARWASFIDKAPDIRSYINDGTYRGCIIADDFGFQVGIAKWAGRPPTGAEIDALSVYIKSFPGWRGVETIARGRLVELQETKPSGGYKSLDGMQYQVSQKSWGNLNAQGYPIDRSKIRDRIFSEMNGCKALGLGFYGGANLINGTGINWNITDIVDGDASRVSYFLSPDDIDWLKDIFAELGNDRCRGIFTWGDSNKRRGDYFLRSDIQAAFARWRDAVKNLRVGPKNYRGN